MYFILFIIFLLVRQLESEYQQLKSENDENLNEINRLQVLNNYYIFNRMQINNFVKFKKIMKMIIIQTILMIRY